MRLTFLVESVPGDDEMCVEVRGQVYCVPKALYDMAIQTFNQQYRRGMSRKEVIALARKVAADLAPPQYWPSGQEVDPFGAERLARVILASKGRASGLKQAEERRKRGGQLELPFG